MRDMTNKEYEAALARQGFRRECFGWIQINPTTSVHPANAGKRRRDRLAYLIKKAEELK